MAAAIRPIAMPKWGLSMTEGTVVAWHVEEGAEVAVGDDLVDIETTKITNVMEAPTGGRLRRRVVPEGGTAPVGALLAVVADAEVGEEAIDAFIADFAAAFETRAAEAAAEAPAPEVVDAAGVPINALAMGDGDGPPIVLVHGFGGDLNNWMFNQPVLAESHRVYALDLPGHGRSGKAVGAGDVAWCAGVVGAALGALGIQRAHLVGHSLGGALALNLALEAPARVTTVTLIAPAGLGPEINGDYIAGFVAAGRRKEMKAVLRDLFADPDLVSRDMVDELVKYKRLDGVDAALRAIADAAFPGGRQATVLADRLGGLRMPMQAIWGAADRIVPPGHAAALPAAVPVHIIDGAGHMPHMEKAAEVNALIAGFVGG